jgi:hypothetical protein
MVKPVMPVGWFDIDVLMDRVMDFSSSAQQRWNWMHLK